MGKSNCSSELDTIWGDDTETRENVEKVRHELSEQAKLDNSIPDLEHEAEIARRLDKLGEPYKSEFYRMREERKQNPDPNDIFSLKEYDIMNLEAMEKSEHSRSSLEEIEIAVPVLKEQPNATIELTAPEILYLNWINNIKVCKIDTFPGYFQYTYNLNFNLALEHLGAGGFLEYSNIEYGLKKSTVAELKEMLKECGYKPKGKKDELISFVLQNLPAEKLSEFDKLYFVATEKGKKVLEDNYCIILFSKDSRINIDPIEAYNYKKEHPNASAYEIGTTLIDKKISQGINIQYYLKTRAFICKTTNNLFEAIQCHICDYCLDYIDWMKKSNQQGQPIYHCGYDYLKDAVDKTKMQCTEFQSVFNNTMPIFLEFLKKRNCVMKKRDVNKFFKDLKKMLFSNSLNKNIFKNIFGGKTK